MEVKVGQIWKHELQGKPRRHLKVIEFTETKGRKVARVENVDTGRWSRVTLEHFTTKGRGFELVKDVEA